MKLRALLLSIALFAGLAWIVGQDPQPVFASRQSCNPAISTVSGSSNVYGTVKNAQGGPGNDISNFPPIEQTNIGPLDITVGMSYRGGGLWQDGSGNRLQLGINATRNPNAGGSAAGACQSAFLQQSSRHDVPEADPTVITSSTTTVKYTVGYELNNNNGTGAGQTYYLQVATSVVPATPPVTPPPSQPQAPVLNVTNTCNGTNSVFNLSWTQVPTNGYALFQNGSQYATVPATQSSTTTGAANPGSTFTYRVEAINNSGRVPSNSVTLTAQNCAPQGPATSVVLNPITNITCVAGNPSHPHIIVSWTATGTITSTTGTPNTMHLVLGSYNIPVTPSQGSIDLFNYNVQFTNGTSYPARFQYQGGASNQQFLTINCPDTPPPPAQPTAPGPFTVSARSACTRTANNSNILVPTITTTLTWTPSANANHYYVGAVDVGAVTTYPVVWNTASQVPIHVQSAIVSQNGTVSIFGTPDGTTAIRSATNPNDFTIADFNSVAASCFATPPGAFTGTVAATCEGTNPIATLTWTAASGATSYKVYDTGTPGDIHLLATVPAGTLTYVDRALRPIPANVRGLQFYVEAVNSAGVNAANIPAQVTDEPAMPNCAPQAALTMHPATSTCTNGTPINFISWDWSGGTLPGPILVLRDGTQVASNPGTGVASGTGGFQDTNVTQGTDYTYTLTSGSVASQPYTVTTARCPIPPAAPQLTVTAACNNNTPVNHLVWTSGTAVGTNATGYSLTRSPSLASAQTFPQGTLSFDDSPVTAGTAYKYTITASNATGATASNEVAVTAANCAPANNPPVANDDATSTKKDTAVTIDVLANDTDTDGNLDPASLAKTQDPAHGTVSLTSDHKTTYTPTGGFVGTDTFKYKVCDTGNLCDDATVTVTINETNQPPVANDDTATVQDGSSVTIDVLANDTDPDNNLDPATVTKTQDPAHGTVTFGTDHKAIYTPAGGFSGTDTFKYKVCDALGLCDDATVTVTVTPKPTPPGDFVLTVQALCTGTTAQNVLAWTASDKADAYAVKRGTQTLIASQTATNYVDTTAAAGTSYTYTVVATNDGGTKSSNAVNLKTADCAPATPNNQPPVANDDTAATDQNALVVIPVLANDTDPDGTIVPACTKVVTAAAHGTTQVDTTNGNIAYTPAKDFSGTDTFVYEMCDDKGAKDTATVTVTVRPPVPPKGPENKPPQANDDAAVTPHDKPVEVDILLNDADPDGNLDPTCVKVTAQPGHGTVTINKDNGRATYTPTAGFAGTDTFKYTVCDKDGAVSNAATVSIAVAEAPPAVLATTGIPILGFFVDLWNKLLTFLHLR